MLDAFWSWLQDPANRDVIGWIGGGVVVVIGGVWAVVKYFAKPGGDGGAARSVRADRGGVAAGGSISNSSINTNSNRIRERLAKADPSNAGWQHGLSVSHNKIGDVQRAQGDLAAALTSYQAALAIAKRLAKADPGNAVVQRDLSVSLNNIGEVQKVQGDLAAALQSYQASLAIIARLAQADPANAVVQRDLSTAHNKIGEVQRAQGDLAAALTSHQVALAIAERLAQAPPLEAESSARPLSIDALAEGAQACRGVRATSAATDLSLGVDAATDISFRLEAPRIGCLLEAGLGLAAVAIGAALGYAFRNEIAAAFGSIAGTLFHGATPPLPAARSATEVIDAIAFAPLRATRGETFVVQVFLGRTEVDEESVRIAALASDPSAGKRAIATLDVELAIGDRIDIRLEAPGLSVGDADQALIWRGKPRSCAFLVTVQKDFAVDHATIQARLYRQAVPVGRITFSTSIVAGTAPELPVPVGDLSRAYRRAFLSYASPDRAEVIKRAQALKAAKIDFFVDLLSLEPGERWERRLYFEIDSLRPFRLVLVDRRSQLGMGWEGDRLRGRPHPKTGLAGQGNARDPPDPDRRPTAAEAAGFARLPPFQRPAALRDRLNRETQRGAAGELRTRAIMPPRSSAHDRPARAWRYLSLAWRAPMREPEPEKVPIGIPLGHDLGSVHGSRGRVVDARGEGLTAPSHQIAA
jgi:tetratricopeptide (TPR) repeat protein